MTPHRFATITRTAFACLGGGLFVMGALALFGIHLPIFRSWFAGALGVLTFAVLTAASLVASRKAQAIFWDGATEAIWLRAQAFKYWCGVIGFAVLGNLAAAGIIGLSEAFLAGALLTASAPFLRFLLAEWRASA